VLTYTAVFAVVIGPRLLPGKQAKAVGLAAGFGIVVSLIVFTVVESFVEGDLRAAGTNEKAGSMIFVFVSPYYWVLMVALVSFEAWLLLRHRAG
jgi:hypothetical protein